MRRIVTVIAIIAGIAACKDTDTAKATPNPASVAPVVAPVPALPLEAPALPAPKPFSQSVLADLAQLPEDVELVAGVDLREANASAAWKILIEPKLVPFRAYVTELHARCGVDLLVTATRAIVGARGVDRGPLEVFAVVHGVDGAALRACLAKPAAGETVATDSTVAVRTVNGVTTAFYFVDDHTLLVEAPRGTREGVVAMAARRSQLATQHRDLLATLDPDATVWAMKPPSRGGPSQPFGVMFGSAELGDGITVDVRGRMSSMQEATQYANLIRTQMMKQTSFVDRLEVEAIGADLRFRVVMMKDKVRVAAGQANGLLELGLE